MTVNLRLVIFQAENHFICLVSKIAFQAGYPISFSLGSSKYYVNTKLRLEIYFEVKVLLSVAFILFIYLILFQHVCTLENMIYFENKV